MRVLVLIVVFSISPSYALDFNKYKEKLRSHMQDMLGTKTTNNILGDAPKKKSEYTVEFPKIPKYEVSATDMKSLNKNIAINFQGAKFDNMSLEEKRKYRIPFIKELYFVTTQSEANEEDIINSLNALEQGGNREGVYRGIVLGEVYSSLESFVEPPDQRLIEFVNKYAAKFLNKAYNNDSIKKLSMYSIKRVVVEQTLELLDVMAPNAKDVYAWYAIFSADLARDHSQVWVNKVRTSKNDAYHYEWAKKVPFQQIKSEVIVKLHKLMNTLDIPIDKRGS